MEKKLGTFFIVYFIIGIFFALMYSWFYHWGALSLFSPGFYVVVLTWPLQIPHFIIDFQQYGFAGKVLI
jgi:hypothetical protein